MTKHSAPYRPPRRAHDVHSICPWCGSEKSSACEFDDAGFCPWEAHEDRDIHPAPLPANRSAWPWQSNAESTIVEIEL